MNSSYEIIKFIYLFTLVFALNFYTDDMVFYGEKNQKLSYCVSQKTFIISILDQSMHVM